MATQPKPETLAERIKRLREGTLVKFDGEEKPMTQKQLADKSGCDVGTISRIENGQIPLVTTAKRIANALGITLDQLMEGVN